jgi:hypothetical protein
MPEHIDNMFPELRLCYDYDRGKIPWEVPVQTHAERPIRTPRLGLWPSDNTRRRAP